MTSAEHPSVSARFWTVDQLKREMLDALDRGSHPQGRLVAGRIVALLATPAEGSSTDMALGFSAIPPGASTEEHSHRAQEVALILTGTGRIFIDDQPNEVGPGTLVLTPSWSRHRTIVTGDEPMLSLWVYAPAGSESRWLPDKKVPA